MTHQIEIEKPKIILMKQVMAEQMIDDTVIATSMAAEWEQIKDSGVLDNMVPNKVLCGSD